MRNQKFYIFVFFLIFLFSFIVLNAINKNESLIKTNQEKNITELNILAIGDSLTEGVGSENSGYIDYLTTYLKDIYNTDEINIHNAGKSGDKTFQITNRISENIEIQQKIKEVDIILITSGGNDLMEIIRKNIFKDFSIKTVEGNIKDYEINLENLYKTINKYNKNVLILHLGIYNPFYLNFSEIEEMQEIVTLWNNTTNNFLNKQKNSYFIPINDEIYKGSGFSNQQMNDLLSVEDSFHPNDKGYQIIANEFKKEIEKRY